ncbi:MAG: CpXC domain-containing protein [Candidatus Cryptobacteroides sp.]
MLNIKENIGTCSNCGEEHKVEVYSGINVQNEPQLKEKIKDGSLFMWECPHCGTRNLSVYQTLYHDPEQKLMIWLLPDGALPPAQMEAVKKALQEQITEEYLSDYVFRRVKDVGSLIEKINISDTGLDDVVMEMCKYVTKMELARQNASKGDMIINSDFRFYKMSGADNTITLSYPFESSMLAVNIGFNVYEDCRGIVMRNPSLKNIKGFDVVDSLWLSGKLR